MVDTVNDRPAYKVSFWYYFEPFGKDVPQLNLREPRILQVEVVYISGTFPLNPVNNGWSLQKVISKTE